MDLGYKSDDDLLDDDAFLEELQEITIIQKEGLFPFSMSLNTNRCMLISQQQTIRKPSFVRK